MMRVSLLRSAVAAGLLATLAAVLAACGADPEPTATPPPPQATPTPAPTATPTPPPPTATAMPRPTPTPEPQVPEGPVLPATVTDVNGNEVVVEDVSRIVSLNGDITEVIFTLGLGDNLVAVDTSATYPAEAMQLPKIGYQRSLSAEGILSMSPTVVIGNTNAGPPPVLEQIRATGTPVVIIDTVTTLDGASRKIRTVAQALGIPDKGEELASQLESEIDEVESLSAGARERPTAVFLYMRGLDALFLIGEDHISHELFETSGAVSGATIAGVTEGFIPLTAESLAVADPDCIVVLSRGLESVGGRDGLMALPGVGQTAAAEEGCILSFDDQYFAGGGPRTGQVLMELLEAFHPDLVPSQ